MSAAVSSSRPFSSSLQQKISEFRHHWRGPEFAVQGMLATALAFYAATLLDLKTPYSAALTVWVVVNTSPGHVIAKSFYRIFGTLAGGTFAIFLIATLNGIPAMLFTVLAIWIGICTGIGNLFRHFRTYAGVLSGYTAAFVLVGAQTHPDHVMNVALDRIASIAIGVISTSLVGALIGQRRNGQRMEEQLKSLQAHLLQALPTRHQSSAENIRSNRLRLSAEFTAAEELLEFADLENPGFRQRIHRRRAMTGLLFDLLDVSRNQPELKPELLEIQKILKPAFDETSDSALSFARDDLRNLAVRMENESAATSEFQALLHIVKRWADQLRPESLDRVKLKDPFDPDVRSAIRHTIRTTASVLLAASFWGLTGWQNGASFLMQSAAICALASTMNHPAKSVVMMTAGVAVAIVTGFFCEFYLMPHADNLLLMMLCLSAVIVPASCFYGSKNPWLANIGATAGLFILVSIQPTNHMVYDPEHFANFATAAFFGTLFNAPIFAIILPTRPHREIRHIRKRLAKILEEMFGLYGRPSFHHWRTKSHRLLTQLRANPSTTPEDIDECLRLYDLGSSLSNLHLASKQLTEFPRLQDSLRKLREQASRKKAETTKALAEASLQLSKANLLTAPMRGLIESQLDQVRRSTH